MIVMILCATTGCTITVAPIAKPKPKPHHTTTVHHKVSPAHHPAYSNSNLIVDSDWMVQYRELETQHGDYRISDDEKVESAGSGKYRVTPAMLKHFDDLIQAPLPKSTPGLR